MRYQQLGETDLVVSVIGFGAATLGNEYGDIDAATGTRAVHAAIDSGINFFDTSPYYGRTLSETRLGEALKGKRDQIILATKGGRYDIDKFNFSKQRLIASVEESLQRLQTDVIDLYHLHDIEFVSKNQIIQEALPTLENLREQGKIRYTGISGFPVHLLKEVAQAHLVDAILSYCHYNLMNTTLADVILPFAKQKGIGIINASALHMGILTEQGAQSWHPAPEILHDTAQQLMVIAREHGTTITAIALQFALDNADISTTLIGMRTVEEVEQNLAILDTKPDDNLLAKIQAVIDPVKNLSWASGLPENYEPSLSS